MGNGATGNGAIKTGPEMGHYISRYIQKFVSGYGLSFYQKAKKTAPLLGRDEFAITFGQSIVRQSCLIR
jgi:hypothetical protein